MPKTIELQVPAEYEDQLKQEMRAAALEAFQATAKKHVWSEYQQRKGEAERLGISPTTLDKLTAQGLPCIVVDGMKLYRNASVDKWLLEHEY